MSDSTGLARTNEQALLERARDGDETAFGSLVDRFDGELKLHCYRIVGSLQDAEDLVQETMLAAWRGLNRFEGRASLRSWLYRIATNRCLNALRDGSRRNTRTVQPEGLDDEQLDRWVQDVVARAASLPPK